MPRRLSVLLIEDDEDDWILTQALLSEVGEAEYALTWAATFDEGLRRLADEPFDVCLLDYNLGEQTGMELLSRALAAGIEVPIIFLTGQSERALDVEATQLGAADFLVKGRIRGDLLERSIRYAMERGRSLSTLRQLNRELELTRNQALQASRAKSKYLATLSQACRRAFGTVLASCDELEARFAAEAAEPCLREIREAGRELLAMLAELPEMDGGEPAAPALDVRRIALGPFVDELVAAIRPLVGHNANTFELICPDDVGSIETDPPRLRRLLLTLLGNTCKFTRRGRIVLEVRRSAGDAGDPGESVEFAIRPSGMWMSPAQIERMFTDHPEIEAGELPRGPDRESGIAGSRRLCHALGGDLRIETEGLRRPALRVRLRVAGPR